MSADTFVLFEAGKVHVFSLPPSDFLKSEQWEGNYIWSGQLKFIREGSFFAVRLLEKDSNEVFGECPIRDAPVSSDSISGTSSSSSASSQQPESVQPATDSTRAFVLRVEEGDQFSYVGLMFEDRTVAYNFSSALIHRRKGLGPAPTLAVQDHSLEQGESITIDLFNKVKRDAKDKPIGATSSIGGGDFGSPLEIPRVSLFSLQTSTAGKSRRVKIDGQQQQQQQQGGAGNASKNEQQQADIFGGGKSSAAQEQSQQQPNKTRTVADIDDVFGAAAPAPSKQAPKTQAQVLDDLFG